MRSIILGDLWSVLQAVLLFSTNFIMGCLLGGNGGCLFEDLNMPFEKLFCILCANY
jgi:hypothetical protein